MFFSELGLQYAGRGYKGGLYCLAACYRQQSLHPADIEGGEALVDAEVRQSNAAEPLSAEAPSSNTAEVTPPQMSPEKEWGAQICVHTSNQLHFVAITWAK